MTDEISPYQKPGRNMDGTFAQGNPATGAGRPPQSYIDMLGDLKFMALELGNRQLTPEALEDIWKQIVEKARKGDKWAINWITQWIVPTPNMGLNVSLTPDGLRIEPITDYRAALRSLAPPDYEDSENDDPA